MGEVKTDCMLLTGTHTLTHTHTETQARIPLIKLFTIVSLTLAHLGTFSPLLRQNVKLYEIRGSSSATQALMH